MITTKICDIKQTFPFDYEDNILNEQREIIALDLQGTQQRRPESPKEYPLSVERYYFPFFVVDSTLAL